MTAPLLIGGATSAQKSSFEEYTMDNGLHVVLQNDPSAPIVITSVMYHVGSNENQEFGFAHFFEFIVLRY
jgi:predicted Zn-dependent peptidase